MDLVGETDSTQLQEAEEEEATTRRYPRDSAEVRHRPLTMRRRSENEKVSWRQV